MEPDKIKYEDTSPIPQVRAFDIWNQIPLQQLRLIKCSDVVPTAVPRNFYEQFQLVNVAGGANHIYLYVYNTNTSLGLGGWHGTILY